LLVDKHRVQHFVPPIERSFGISERVVARRCLREAGNQCGLLEIQLLGRARSTSPPRPRSPRVVSIEHLIHVRGQDPVLTTAVRLDGKACLGELPLQRPLSREVEVADKLLRDRRAALRETAGTNIRDDGARNPHGIEAAVLIEAPVFDRHGRLRHPAADLAARYRRAVPLSGNHAELGTVCCEDERVLPDRYRAKSVESQLEPKTAVANRPGDEHDHGEADEHRNEHAARLFTRPRATLAPAAVGVSRRRRHSKRPARRRPWAHTQIAPSRRGGFGGAAADRRRVAVERAHVHGRVARLQPLREGRRPPRRDRLTAERNGDSAKDSWPRIVEFLMYPGEFLVRDDEPSLTWRRMKVYVRPIPSTTPFSPSY
jgi:hypothetical protein